MSRRRLFGLLRFRLALWHSVSLALLLGLFGTLVYGLLRNRLLHHHDSSLRETAAKVMETLSETPDCAVLNARQTEALDSLGHLILLHDVEGKGEIFYRSPETVETALPFDVREAAPFGSTEPWFETFRDESGEVRVFSAAYRSHAGRRGLIRIMERLGDVREPLANLRLALLLMTGLTVVIVAAGGFRLAWRALEPVDRIASLAREIDAENLGRRLPGGERDNEIGRLVTTLNEMIARLQSSFEGMRRFTADASHELRTPLTVLRGTVDVALTKERSAAEYREALLSIGEEVDTLQQIVEDLLLLARADAGQSPFRREDVRLDSVVEEVLDSLRERASASGVELAISALPPVRLVGDESWLRQLVFNLVENGVKFTASDTEPGRAKRVAVDLSEDGGIATLVVTDSGPGIPDDEFQRVFERFYRGGTARAPAAKEGSGLGLAISAWIVRSHAGTIRAERPAEGGARFVVTLPALPPASKSAPA